MIRFKKYISLVLVLLLVISNGLVPINASTSTSEKITDDMVVYEQYFKLEDDGFVEIDPNSRQIPEADLYLQFQIDPEISNNKVNRIYVRYLYSWLNTPINRFTDKMAVAWSNSNFELDENTFEKVDQYTRTTDGRQIDFTHEYRGTSFSEQAVSWDADLPGWHLAATDLDGFGMFYLVPKTNVSVGTSITFYGTYVHMQLNGSAGFEFKGTGISVTNPRNCDEAAIQKKVTLR